MEQNNMHEVDFHNYCPQCKWKDAPDKPDPKIPCDECLEVPFREASHIPEYYDGPLPKKKTPSMEEIRERVKKLTKGV